MPALAIDIGAYSLKLVSGTPAKKPIISRVVEAPNNLGFVMPGDDEQASKLGEVIFSIINDNKLPRTGIRLSLPESAVSSKVIAIPPLSDAELASAIEWQAEQYIPIPKEELALQYQVLYRPPKTEKQKTMKVLLVGARKSVVERFTNMFLGIGIEPVLLETQIFSVIRSLDLATTEPPTLVANLGASAMDMGVVDQGELGFVFTNPLGGKALSKALEQEIGLDPEQAEQYKRQYGLDASQFEGKVRQALLPAVDSMVSEFIKSIRYFQSENPGGDVRRIVLSGGASQLPGLTQYLTEKLNAEVLLADPFYDIKGEVPTTNRQAFTISMGLLMREL
jgi:type IV pilus assembly protein PilM